MVKALEPYSSTASPQAKGDGSGGGIKNDRMYVLKRDGRKEAVHFDKITSRIRKLSYGLNMDFIDPPAITFKVGQGLSPTNRRKFTVYWILQCFSRQIASSRISPHRGDCNCIMQ